MVEESISNSMPILKQKATQGFCSIRCMKKRFGISFIVADRIASEISDKKRILGKHPLRITRFPFGGPTEFHKLVEEAQIYSKQLIIRKHEIAEIKYRPNPKKAYHRNRINDWHTQVLYITSSSSGILDPKA